MPEDFWVYVFRVVIVGYVGFFMVARSIYRRKLPWLALSLFSGGITLVYIATVYAFVAFGLIPIERIGLYIAPWSGLVIFVSFYFSLQFAKV